MTLPVGFCREVDLLAFYAMCESIGLVLDAERDKREEEECRLRALTYLEGGDTPENRAKLAELVLRLKDGDTGDADNTTKVLA